MSAGSPPSEDFREHPSPAKTGFRLRETGFFVFKSALRAFLARVKVRGASFPVFSRIILHDIHERHRFC
jgi:hypothetical protein